jgi:transcriptional regulator with XRE-family HTH domain
VYAAAEVLTLCLMESPEDKNNSSELDPIAPPVAGQCRAGLSELLAPSEAELRRKLRAIREHHGWNQAQGARAFGVSNSAYAKWESGARTPGPTAIRLICLHYAASCGKPVGIEHLFNILHLGYSIPSSGVQLNNVQPTPVGLASPTSATNDNSAQHMRVMAAQAFIFDTMHFLYQQLVDLPNNKNRAKRQYELSNSLATLSSKLAELVNLCLKIAPNDKQLQFDERPKNVSFGLGTVVAAQHLKRETAD